MRVLEDYPRRRHLEFYRGYPNPFYSVTFELEVTALRRRLKEEGLPVYAGLVWGFHRALQSLAAFRVRLLGDEVVLYEGLKIGATAPGPRGRPRRGAVRERVGIHPRFLDPSYFSHVI